MPIRPRLRRVLAVCLAMLHLAGCSTWRRQDPLSLSALVTRDSPDNVRLTTIGGVRVELSDPAMRGDSIADQRNAVAVSDVAQVETRHFSTGRTLVLIASLPVVLVIVAAVSCAASGDDCYIAGGGP